MRVRRIVKNVGMTEYDRPITPSIVAYYAEKRDSGDNWKY